MYEVPFGEEGGSGDLDKMRLALAKQNKPAPTPPSAASQIPGYGKPVPPAQTKPDPLSAAAGNFTELATKYNPLMMMKSMQESVRTLNPVPPIAGAWADVAQNVQTAGAEAMYDILGDPQGIMKMQKNYVPVTTGRFYQAPTTQLGKEFETDVTKAMDASKIPAVWPMALNQPIRPPITPNDVRVMGAEATRVGRQIKDIPTDFVNAQSGMQRLDPITGRPTMGSRLGQAERGVTQAGMRVEKALDPVVQDIMAKGGTSADILAAMAGQPLYAMRPEGSRVTSATLPATAKADAATYAPAQEIINNVIDSTTMTPVQALDEIQNNILRKPEAASARRAFESFLKQKANEMYPDAPSEGAALSAYKARFGDREASAAHTLEMYDQFLQTPNGIQYRAALDLPSAEELPAMHEAAANWLNSQFTNYIVEKVGTPNEPAAKLASQGLTFYPPSEIFDSADMSGSKIGAKRTAAGMPAKTPTDEALAAADQKLADLVQQSADAATRKREQEAIAKQLGYGAIDPNTGVVVEGMNLGRYEPFAQASRESDKANTAYKKQQKVVDNLRLGAAYENATDKAIHAPFAKNLKEEIEYSERQFYPALMQTPDTERAYIANPVQLRNLGFEDLAKSFYSDVMSRKIHLDKVPKMTVEKYIRDTAEGRIAAEKLAQAKEKQFKMDADAQFKLSADTHIPNDKVFGNVGALEITNRFTPDEVAKLVSEDTLALDVCIGEGGNVRDRPNPWHPGTGDRQYIPIYDIVTGQRNPDATSPRMGFINAVANGSQMVSFRDTVTGEPVAIFDLNPSSLDGKYNIHFASGRKNGKIKPEYVEGIKSYLNSRADSIHDVGTFLYDHTGINDRKRMQNRALAGMIDMPISQFERYDLAGLPRFVTRADIRNHIENLKANEPVEQVPAVLSQRPSESLSASLSGTVASSIDNTLDSQRRAFDEAGESNQFVQAETFFTGIRENFDRYLQAEGPVRALELTNQELYDLENEYANSPRIVANIIAEGIRDLQQTLGLQADYVAARQAADAVQPRAIAVQGDRIPDMDTTELLIEYRDRLTPEQVQWLENFDDRWNGQEGSTDEGQQGLVDEYERWRDANRLLPEQAPDYLRMTHDAALQLDRQMGVDAGDELRSVFRVITEGSGLDPVRDTDAFITALRSAAEVAIRGSVETALNELADDMYTAYIRDWEPEVGPAANAPAQQAPAQPFDWVRAVDRIADVVATNFTPVIADRFDTIAQRVAENNRPRIDPAGYALALRRAADPALEHIAVLDALRDLATQIEESIAPAQPQQPTLYRPATQDQASVALMQINREIGNQARLLSDEHNEATTQLFATSVGRLYTENNLNEIGDTPGSLNRFGNYLQGYRDDLAAQIPYLQRDGFTGIAAASAIQNVINEIDVRLVDFRLRAADLDNMRNDRVIEIENALNNPELDPEDLRRMANNLGNPLTRDANNHWISLTDTERRAYSQELHQRANYIEFSPADFAIRLSNEAGANIPELRDTIEALNAGNFDHEILRGLPVRERGGAEQRTALNLNHILQGMQADAQHRGNNTNLRGLTTEDLRDQITVMDTDTGGVWQRVNSSIDRRLGAARRQGLDPDLEANDIRNGFGLTNDVTPVEREYIAREVATTLQLDAQRAALNPNGVPEEPIGREAGADPIAIEYENLRDAAEDLVNGLEEAYYTDTPNPRAAVRLIRQHLRALRRNGEMAYEDIFGMATTAYEWSPELLTALEIELESLIERYQGMDGYANGGPVRGYQAGGSVKKPEVKTPYLFSVPTYSETVAYEMYPGQKGQNDQRDAARHMLAAGTLSRKYGPKTAEFLGKAHEYVTSPLQSVKSMFTGKMPADYDMDTHNNTIGARLGQRAKSQAELEDLVQEEAERASRTQTQDKAFIKKANGGIVQQNPTTDQMRYALMMRRK